MVYRLLARCAVFCGVAFLITGCGKSGPDVDTVDVSGTVTLDGNPLGGVTVFFIGEGSQFVGMGTTGPDGKYKLDRGSIPGMQGAMPGKNQVYFTKEGGAAAEPPMIPSESSLPAPAKDSPIPAKYTNPAKPELTFDVPAEGTDKADFQLASR